ncbi:ATP-binding protein [Priestia aryabhattai]|uniref:ATP-binding protein n=1 Tax=Priestia aryabhattai TaxID=412384 RepID=UPI003D2DC2B8
MYKKMIPHVLLTIFFIVGYDSISTISKKENLTNVTSFFEHYSTFFIGSLFVMIGIFCYVQKMKSQVATSFFYLMYVTGVAISFSKPSSLGLTPAREIEMLSVSFSPFLLMHFFSYFPVAKKPKIFHKVKLISLWMAILIYIIYLSLTLNSFEHHPTFFYLFRVGVIINIVIALIASLGLIILHLRSNSLWVKNQLYILTGSMFISFAPVLIFSLIPNGIFHLDTVPFYYSLNSIIVFPVTLAYLLMKQEIIDINISIKKHSYTFLNMGLTLILINVLFSYVMDLAPKQSVKLNTCIITSLLIFYLIQKLFEPLQIKRWKRKNEEIQSEKRNIFHKILEEKHFTACAKHIITLLHKVIEVEDACIILRKKEPTILYQTGIFKDIDTCNYLIKQIGRHVGERLDFFRKGPYSIFPLQDGQELVGWMIIGRKKNLTAFTKEEFVLLKTIQGDSAELLSNAHAIYRIERELRRTQQQSDMFNHFNTVLLDNLEEEKRNLSIFLHDEVLQSLIFIKTKLQLATENKTDIEDCIQNTIYDVREMCNDLHPIMVEDLGLEPSLQALKRKLQMNHNVLISLNFHLRLKILPINLSIRVFRMIKELIHNSIKHASPSTITVSILESAGVLIIKVQDDGRGFEMSVHEALSKQSSIGLASIEKKVNLLSGILDISSEQNIGTSIMIKLPFEGSELIENQGVIGR